MPCIKNYNTTQPFGENVKCLQLLVFKLHQKNKINFA